MIDWIEDLFNNAPLLALFITVALGYIVGKLRFGSFILGGVAGTLIVGVVIGQFEVSLSDDLKTMFFALFIYAVGYQGGPQFVQSLSRRSLNQLASAATMCIVGLFVVLGFSLAFDLDRGTAAGLGAGGLTQSAIIGTADEAIAELPDLSSDQIKEMQTNVAVGYAITYIFGQIGPIIAVTWLFPMLMHWNLRKEAKEKALRMSGGVPELEPGEAEAVEHLQTRFYQITAGAGFVGKSIDDIDTTLSEAVVEAVVREGSTLDPQPDIVLEEDDIVAVTGFVRALEKFAGDFGSEVTAPPSFYLVEEQRDIIITNPKADGQTLDDLRDEVDVAERRGVFPVKLVRYGREMPLLDDVEINRGDEITLAGRPADLDAVEPRIGYKITRAQVTDFIFFGFGMALGVAIGQLAITVGNVPLTLGTGGGALVSGLLFGWLRSTHPMYAALPLGASNFLRDFGLAVFVGVVGLTAGPQALDSLEQNGIELFLLGIGVTMIPMLIVFPISYYLYRIKDPIDSMAAVTGGRSANPAFGALLDKAGNATPTAVFTITYALANVLLTVWGPIIVGVVPNNVPS